MKLIPIILSAIFFAFIAEPVYSITQSFSIEQGKQGIHPIAVWISCNGIPVALVVSSSYGYVAGDIPQITYGSDFKPGGNLFNAALTEAELNNTMANIDLGQRDWFECRVK